MADASPAQTVRYPVSGWIEAGLFVLVLALLNVAYVIGQGLDAHPIALVLYATTASALALLAVTGLGADAWRIVTAPQSWLVGIGAVGIEIAYYLLLEYVSPALGSLITRLAIPLSFLVGWVLFGRRPRGLAMVGAGLVLATTVMLLALVAPEHRAGTLAAGLAATAASILRTFATEFHPWNRNAVTVREKMRVTGLVVLVTSLAGLALAGGCALLIAGGWLPPTRLVPTGAQMLHVPTILLGGLPVAAILTAMSVFSFTSVVKITSENFAAVGAFTPLVTLLMQMAAVAMGIIPAYAYDASLLPGMAGVIAGVLLILYAARRR